MPGAFRFLVDAGPFLAEKPWGIDDTTVNELANYAEQRKAWATAPMSFRHSWWAEIARKMVRSGELGTISPSVATQNRPCVAI